MIKLVMEYALKI